MRKDDCIFCKIANGVIPSKALYEDDAFKVILDLSPATKGHALIIPKNHYDNLYVSFCLCTIARLFCTILN